MGHNRVLNPPSDAEPLAPERRTESAKRNYSMKTKTTKQPNKSKPSAKVKDLQAKKSPKGGILRGLLLPAVQKVR